MARPRTTRTLNVYASRRRMGVVTSTGKGQLEFRYDPMWLSATDAYPVSLSMPLSEKPYRDGVTTILDNLLPDDSDTRRTIAARIGAAGTDPFSLLFELGRDCVGSLQFVPENEVPVWNSQPIGEVLTDEQVEEVLRSLTVSPLGASTSPEFRISVAGAQEKTALLRLDDSWMRPAGTTPSTHIVKPPIGVRSGVDLSESVENEYVCMLLARSLGLPVANVEMHQFSEIRALVVERFDRAWLGEEVIRLPQEDLCQALSVPSFRKYESSGGPGMNDVLELLQQSDDPEADRKQFLQTCFAFWLLGATDGHAKNFSLALGPHGSFRLTPLYDVMSLQPSVDALQVRRREFTLAMAAGSNRHYKVDETLPRHFLQTAASAGIDVSISEVWLSEIAGRLASAVDEVRTAVGSSVPEALFDSITQGALKRSALMV